MFTKVHIRWVSEKDKIKILELEKFSFPEPWSEEDFQKVGSVLVAEHGSNIVGYIAYDSDKKALNLRSIAVSPDWRRQNIGSQLIEKMIAKSPHKRKVVKLVVNEYNLESQLFFKELGFRATGSTRRFFDNGSDGIEFCYKEEVEVLV